MNFFERWLFRPQSVRALALFRIGWSLAALAICSQEFTRGSLYEGTFYRAPLLPCFVLPHDLRAMLTLATWGALASLVGVGSRFAVPTVVLNLGYLFCTDLLLFRNHVYLALLLGLLLAFSPCDQALSLFRWRPWFEHRSAPAAQLIKAQVVLVYAWSALNKLRPAFLSGWTLQRELPTALARGLLASTPLADWLRDDRLASAAAWMVFAVEAFLALALLGRGRRYAVPIGLAFHLLLFAVMNVFSFGCLMIASYPLFALQAKQGRAAAGVV